MENAIRQSTDMVQVSPYNRSEGHVAAVNPGQSKVSQLHLALTGYQNILWFQVPVHHAVRVKECKTTQQLFHQVLQKKERKRESRSISTET